jgi:hypothetical protein
MKDCSYTYIRGVSSSSLTDIYTGLSEAGIVSFRDFSSTWWRRLPHLPPYVIRREGHLESRVRHFSTGPTRKKARDERIGVGLNFTDRHLLGGNYFSLPRQHHAASRLIGP